MVYILLTCAVFISISAALDVDKDNCVNGNILVDDCMFNISFTRIGNNKLNCTLVLKDIRNITLNNKFYESKGQENNQCPSFIMTIFTDVGKKLSVTCGGNISPFTKTFSNFNNITIDYNHKFNDLDTRVKLDFGSTTPCKTIGKNIYIIVIIVVAAIIIFIVVIVCIVCIMSLVRKRNKSKYGEVPMNPTDRTAETFKRDYPATETTKVI